VKTVAGIVNSNGTPNVATANGFSVAWLADRIHQLNFPRGTWKSFPAMTVTPFGVFGACGYRVVTSLIGFGMARPCSTFTW
jgi:hypothetical protein